MLRWSWEILNPEGGEDTLISKWYSVVVGVGGSDQLRNDFIKTGEDDNGYGEDNVIENWYMMSKVGRKRYSLVDAENSSPLYSNGRYSWSCKLIEEV